ncbi:TIGR02186 family protein [Polycladidibacter stylochi]|uniref:TIGR02186 family protein n=1 Tax=Polycladidibacter stylochi TaxID=1807766 RepID=UPI00082EFF2E|nr:TIGR02186 family protein [Pseudovibrio stylochi]
MTRRQQQNAAQWLVVSLGCYWLMVLCLTSAQAESLVSAISSPSVSITSNFTGTDILVFGEVNRDKASVPRVGKHELVVVVEGPKERVVTWRKERILGLWINANSRTYTNVPSFYAVHTSGPLSDIGTEETLKQQRIGLQNLPLAPIYEKGQDVSERQLFKSALIRKKQEADLYAQREGAITFLSPTLFSTTVPLPSNIAVGEYTITTYLYHGSALLTSQTQHLHVAKTGFEQHTYALAHEKPLLYGLVAVLLALFTGWLAGMIFRKD